MNRYNNYSQEAFKCRGELPNKDLWRQFHDLDTEMIITRSGRRMFPALRMNISELDPEAYYCILLELTPVDAHKHRYSSSSGVDAQGAWAAAGPADIKSQRPLYVHPDGPAPGRHWMYTAVSFGRLKLTNTMNAPSGHMVLASMHRYQPRVIVVQLRSHAVELDMRSIHQLGPRGYGLLPHDTVTFPETAFIAVTAYQNHKITKLKIDNNPFAKGFRENGQSKSKRKRPVLTVHKIKREDDHDIDVDDSRINNAHVLAITSSTHDGTPNGNISSSLSVSSENSSSMSSGYPSPPLEVSSEGPTTTTHVSFNPPPARAMATLDVLTNYYHHQLLAPPSMPVYIYYPHYHQSPLQLQLQSPVNAGPVIPEDLSKQHMPKKPRKLTDFSIKAITGLS